MRDQLNEPSVRRRLFLGGDFLVDAEVFLDRRDAFQRMIDFLAVAGHVVLEVGEPALDVAQFPLDTTDLGGQGTNVLFGCHVAFDVSDVAGDGREPALHARVDFLEPLLHLAGYGRESDFFVRHRLLDELIMFQNTRDARAMRFAEFKMPIADPRFDGGLSIGHRLFADIALADLHRPISLA